MKNNQDIRDAAKAADVHLYEIARAYGCNDGNFTRKLRWELPDDEKAQILKIIDDLAQKKGDAVCV